MFLTRMKIKIGIVENKFVITKGEKNQIFPKLFYKMPTMIYFSA